MEGWLGFCLIERSARKALLLEVVKVNIRRILNRILSLKNLNFAIIPSLRGWVLRFLLS